MSLMDGKSSDGIRRPLTALAGAAALVLLVGAGGCDEVVQAVGCAAFSEFDVDVNLTTSGVQPTEAGVVSANPSGRSDLPDVDLEAVGISSDQITLNVSGTGSVRYVIAVNDTVIGYGDAAVADGSLTDPPGRMNFGSATQAQIDAVLATIPAGQRPNWVRVSASVAQDVVTRAVNANRFTIAAAYISTGNVTGSGTIESVTFYLDC
jgi:hypothetical protein